MPARFYENAEFYKLQREWAKKLHAAGFRDIEGYKLLKRGKSDYYDTEAISNPAAPARSAYFTQAGRWLWQKVWPSRLHKRLWELHSEGVGMRESTLRCWPARGNHKSSNEMRIYAARAEMRTWLGSAVMASESESEAPLSAWAEAMLAEGYDPAGYLVASEGLQRDHRNFQDQARAADQLATDTAAAAGYDT